MKSLSRVLIALVPLCLPIAAVAESVADIESEGIERIAEGQQAQQAVDEVNARTRALVDRYQDELKLVRGLETYIELLDEQLQGQRDEISILQRSIGDVALVERQILPLLKRMIDALDDFVAADIPFLPEERTQRLEKLRNLLGRSDVTVAEKARRVFEGFQVENDYGRTIEAYTGKLSLEGATYDAEFLRVGRLSLMYRTVGADRYGHWNAAAGDWQELDKTPWERLLRTGLRVARQEVAPELIHIAVDPAEAAR